MLKFKNFASGTLAAGISASSTSIVLSAGNGAKFPAISGGDTFSCVLTDGTQWEEVLVTAVSGDTFTVTRAADGVAQAWPSGTAAELRVTRVLLESMAQSATLGNAATRNVGTTAGTVAAGDDARLSDERVPTAAGLAGKTHAAPSKATPVDADELPLADSASSWSLAKLTWASIKAALKTYFDSLYLAVTGGTITDTASAVGGASAGSALTVNQTWATTGTPTAVKINVTDTASDAASRLMDLQVGGVSAFRVVKPDWTPYFSEFNGMSWVFGQSGSFKSKITHSGNESIHFISYGKLILALSGTDFSPNVQTMANFSFGWSSSNTLQTQGDLKLFRDAANTLAQRNGTNAQTFRLYGTYTDASNYRRVSLGMTTAGVATLTPEGAGTGASGNTLMPVTGSVTVANLPTASSALTGARLFVSDATATTFLSTVAGGGSNKVPVVCDGTNWLIG